MFRKIILSLVLLSLVLCMSSCTKETKTLTCDGCGKTVETDADSKMEENWIIFCAECGEPEIDFASPYEQ